MRLTAFKLYEMKYTNILYPLEELQTFPSPKDKRVKLIRDSRSYQTEDGMWHVRPFAESENSVYIVCPFCGEIHCHGYTDGHRWSHCKDHPSAHEDSRVLGGYVLEGTEEH